MIKDMCSMSSCSSDQVASTSSSENSICNRSISIFQSLLAVSHKYALTRLQRWCEVKLCEYLSIDTVCSILCQAHLYEALPLAEKCLGFIRQYYETVAVTEKFGTMAIEWPEIMLKINLFMGKVREDMAALAMDAARRAATGK